MQPETVMILFRPH